MNQPVLDAIADHSRIDVRLKAIHLLSCTGQPSTFDQLRELALRDGISEVVKTALLEGLYKLDPARLQADEGVERAFDYHAEPQSSNSESEWNDESPLDSFQEVTETVFEFSPSQVTSAEVSIASETSDDAATADFEVSTSDFEFFASAVEQIEEPVSQSDSESAAESRDI